MRKMISKPNPNCKTRELRNIINTLKSKKKKKLPSLVIKIKLVSIFPNRNFGNVFLECKGQYIFFKFF